MKTRYPIAISLLAAIGFIATQSFYTGTKKTDVYTRRTYFKAFPRSAAMCVPIFSAADSAIDLPALKGWGNYRWKISHASDSVQFYFNQGINMYYAFHDIEAIASFTKATRLGPDCAMAWYGKALALGPNINYPNGYRPPSGAYEAAVKSQQLSVQCTDLEKDLINAISQRYSADTTIDVNKLKANYADAMKLVYEKHKNNAEAVTLYGDALLLLHPWDLYEHDFTPKPWTPQIRSIFEQALKLSPKHPGANHYYIHTMEGSATPELALKSANVLDTLMPQVSHVTHMPSHIYIRTGDYKKGITNNDEAVKGYKGYLKIYAPVENDYPLYEAHNVHMKINCAQMAGNYKIAMDASTSLQASIPPFYLSLKGAMGNYVQYVYMEPMFTNLRFGKWDEVLKTKVPDSLIFASLLSHFARGVAYSRKGNFPSAKRELGILNKLLSDTSLKAKEIFSPAIEPATVAQLILKGVIADGQKNYTAAINFLQQAVQAEDHLIYNEPRDWPIPARQFLANVLLKTGKYNEAIAVLKRDLVINPKNGWSLTGLRSAYTQTNNKAELAQVNTRLKNAFSIKDTNVEQPVF
jgi:tetratricopeptide (TPR) repeat protein